MRPTVSGYLSIYNDFDILPYTLKAIAPYTDELIVVDGAYKWMEPYLERIGCDPTKSDAPVYDALEASGINYRVISRTWENEVEKRTAGYSACSGRYAFRIDADEVPFFDDSEFDKFLASGAAVAEMFKPSWVAPGWFQIPADVRGIPAEPFIFDRSRVSPEMHLNYLWLVLGPDKLPTEGRPFPVRQPAIGTNAHLVMLRDVQSATNRQTFYWLHWMRQNGAPWDPELRGKPIADFRTLVDRTGAHTLREMVAAALLTADVAGRQAWRLTPSAGIAEQEALVSECFARMTEDRARLNRQFVDGGASFWRGLPIIFDITSPSCRDAIVGDGGIALSCSADIVAVSATQMAHIPNDPWHEITLLECSRHDNKAFVRVPAANPSHLRCEVRVQLSHGEPSVQRFHVEAPK